MHQGNPILAKIQSTRPHVCDGPVHNRAIIAHDLLSSNHYWFNCAASTAIPTAAWLPQLLACLGCSRLVQHSLVQTCISNIGSHVSSSHIHTLHDMQTLSSQLLLLHSTQLPHHRQHSCLASICCCHCCCLAPGCLQCCCYTRCHVSAAVLVQPLAVLLGGHA